MGFNLQSACIEEVFGEEDAPQFAALIHEQAGPDVPLGTPGNGYCHHDEMGWSWWHQLKVHALDSLGPAHIKFLTAVDAWHGVYVDAPIDRLALRLNPEPASAPSNQIVRASPPTFLDKVRSAFGFAPKQRDTEDALRTVIDQMHREFGPRAGEQSVLQVSSLRGVLEEANELLAQHGTNANAADVEELLATYSSDDARVDKDPHIQCLCHLWLTATHALEHRQPMWVIK